MKKYMSFSVGCLIMLMSAGNIFAQTGFTGPAGGYNIIPGQAVMVGHPITISEARNLPHDSWVVITGNIINMLPGGRQYTFRDTTGEIAADIGPKEWRGLSVGASDKVEIHGEVKSHRGLIHIKVHAIRKIEA
ncbi:MAG: NirD/YgiW/YdeI family stress tolerance protein [Treponema sp.]|nr:NirD/YgiW/YdeI family stress tolerance protein [Treponema sp.]